MKKIILLLSIALFSCGNPQKEKLTNDVENHFAKLADSCQVVTSNLYNKETATIGQAILSNGTFTINTNNVVSEFIQLEPSTTYSYSGAKGLGNYNYLYDSNYNPVRSLGALVNGSFTTNATTEIYARFTVGNASFGTGTDKGMLQINKGATVDYLQPFGVQRCLSFTDFLPENAVLVLIDLGQSNALGACVNNTGGSFKSERQQTNIVQEWNKTAGVFQNQNIDSRGSHGINLTLQKLAYKLSRPFYYVNCAVGGTNISKHLPPNGSVYLTTNTAIVNSINQLIASGKRPFVWVRWVQGESDSTSQTGVNAYTNKQISWLNFWKSKLGQNVPFIFGGINVWGIEPNPTYDVAINQTKINLANQGLVTFYDVTQFSFTVGNDEHRNYNGYAQEANYVWNLLNQIQPTEITQTLNL